MTFIGNINNVSSLCRRLLAQRSSIQVLVAPPVIAPVMKTTAGALAYPYGKATVRVE